jgi:hypothetical protein
MVNQGFSLCWGKSQRRDNWKSGAFLWLGQAGIRREICRREAAISPGWFDAQGIAAAPAQKSLFQQ